MDRRRGRIAFVAAVGTAAALGLAACGSDSDSTGGTQLTWYINPDGGGSDPNGGGQAQLAKECTAASDGAYDIGIELLPNEATDQRQQLLRRLASNDTGVDIMSIDPVFVAEFAEAGYLAEVPAEIQSDLREDSVDPALESAMWKDTMYAAPFWANTQLLWYRKSVAREAGLDMTKPVTWEQVIEAAEATDTEIGVQASPYEGYVAWINALVEGSGGAVVTNPGADGPDLEFGLETEAGANATQIIKDIADKNVAGPAMGSTNETTTLDMFQNDQAGFMVNWIYVYATLKGGDSKAAQDLGWARYPQTVAGEQSKPPLGGIEMGVNAASENENVAWDAVECLTSKKGQTDYMLGSGNPAARKSVYDNPEIKKQFPMAELIRYSLDTGAPRPLTQYYGDVSAGIQEEYSPPGSVDPDSTPRETTSLLEAVLRGDALL